MKDACVEFSHFRFEFSDEMLSEFGSRYLPKMEAGKELRRLLLSNSGSPTFEGDLIFPADQIECANEVFPEAALADPVADLEVWEEWRSGIRRFPYPGVYSRLSIFSQERKTAATSSIGVMGEILTGLLSQCYVAPFVTVRPVRRWPDFILLGKDDRYHFVESKASATLQADGPAGLRGIREELFAEGLRDAVQELTAEPLIKVWLSFSDIVEVDPLSLRVRIVEVDSPANRRLGRKAHVPRAVTHGLTEQLVFAVAADMEEAGNVDVFGPRAEAGERRTVDLWKDLTARAEKEVDRVLEPSVPAGLITSARDAIGSRLKELRRRRPPKAADEGRKFREAKKAAAKGMLTSLRRSTTKDASLMLADLPSDGIRTLGRSWRPDWAKATTPWGKIGPSEMWRCSSAVLSVANAAYEGAEVFSHATDG